MKDTCMLSYLKMLKQYKCLGALALTTVFEILRGLLATSGTAWGINWITEGCISKDVMVFSKGAILFSGATVASAILVFAIEWAKKRKMIHLGSRLRCDCITKTYEGDYAQVKKIDKSEWMYRVNNNVQQISNLFEAIQLCFGGIGKIAGSLVYGFIFSWHLTCVLLGYGLIKIYIDKKLLVKLYKVNGLINKQKSETYSLIRQMVQGVSFYKYLADDIRIDKKFDDKMNDFKEVNVKGIEIERNINTVYRITEIVAWLSVLLLGAMLADEQIITMGAFVSFLSIYDTLINPYRFIGDFLTDYHKSKVGCINILEILDIKKQKESKAYRALFSEKPYKLCVNEINFSYDKEILKHVSFEAKSGEVTYIVGKSGSGKSTLFNIIGGLLNADGGEIHIEDKAGEKIALNPRYVTYISQKPFLFNGTIQENICMQSEEEIDEIQLATAIEKSGCQEFISSLEQGVDHYISDDGNNFSGGQKCRLALARVFYKTTPIILMDELYASLDNKTVAKIEKAINELLQKNYCVLSVMHREEWIPKSAVIVEIGAGNNG